MGEKNAYAPGAGFQHHDVFDIVPHAMPGLTFLLAVWQLLCSLPQLRAADAVQFVVPSVSLFIPKKKTVRRPSGRIHGNFIVDSSLLATQLYIIIRAIKAILDVTIPS